MKKFSFGVGFADNLFWGKSGKPKHNINITKASQWYEGISLQSPISKKRLGETIATEISEWRLVPLYLMIAAIFILLLTRLIVLQVIEGSIFLSQAQGNGVRIKTIYAPRGVIYDRNGEVLARNRPAFRVGWDLSKTKVEERDKVLKQLPGLIGVTEEEIKAKVAEFDALAKEGVISTDPVTIKTDLDQQTVLKLETKEKDLPGVVTEATPVREYPYGEALAHVLGYTGEISLSELEKDDFKGYKAGDTVGKDGLEKQFETNLRGQNGQELLKVDSTGVRLGTVYSATPVAGNDLVLSLDVNLQKKAYASLKKAVDEAKAPGGSVVVTDPETGAILALASYPSFDNNLFAAGISSSDYSRLIEDSRTPLLNRVIQAAYPPGSTFKIITGISGLEAGKVQKETIYEDTGSVTLGPITFSNWYFTQHGRKEGPVDLIKALQRSNDTYFYLSSQAIGEKIIQDYSFKFGLGQTTGINLPGEVPGLVPTDEWKRKVRGEPWYPGNTLNLAIGQGDLLTTPLQINSMTQVVAAGGKLLSPTLLKGDKIEILRDRFTTEENLAVVEQGLIKVNQTGGTAWPFFGFKTTTAGKTGTAESGSEKPHAWYTGYGPVDQPQLVVTAMLEKAGEGSSVASPVVKDIMNWWFYERVGQTPQEASFSGERIGD